MAKDVVFVCRLRLDAWTVMASLQRMVDSSRGVCVVVRNNIAEIRTRSKTIKFTFHPHSLPVYH